MRERPILMTPENAQKCHDGTKTQTRRIVSVPSWASDEDMLKLAIQRPATGIAYFVDGMPVRRLTCPYGVVGDRLWVREAFCLYGVEGSKHPLYRGQCEEYPSLKPIWKPSLHMPRWACRTVLEITEVRVERLNEISEEDAKAEGVEPIQKTASHCHQFYKSYRLTGDGSLCERTAHDAYMTLWESIHGKGSWALNPYVWVISFRKVEVKP